MIRAALVALALAGCGNRFECDEGTPCDFGETCVAGRCQEPTCATSAQCPIETHCANRRCVPGCEDNDDCKPGFACTNEGTCARADCEDTQLDCGFREFCNTATGECYDAGNAYCRPCEAATVAQDCGAGAICYAGYCGISCDGGRECPGSFECGQFVNGQGVPVGNYCFTFCWLYEDYEPGSFVREVPPRDLQVCVDEPPPVAAVIAVLLLLAACDGAADSADTADFTYDGPALTHAPAASIREGTALNLVVVAADDDGVARVRVFYRTAGRISYEPLDLVVGAPGWTGTIPAGRVEAPGVEYYFHAIDASDLAIPSTLPEDGYDHPFLVPVDVIGLTLPFVEGFEGAGSNIFALGWTDVPRGTTGFSFDLTTSRAHTGARAALHRRGAPTTTGIDDWLVSPPLNLSEPAQLSWFESGDAADTATHSLWISTGSPRPQDGDFTLLRDLPPPPEDSWGRSEIVPLDVAAPVAYLAWRYQGGFADAWAIDDVTVEAPGPDVRFAGATWDRVDPGGQTTLHVTLRNASAEPAENLMVRGAADPARATFGDSAAPGTLAGNAEVTVALPLTVRADHLDNARLPVTVLAEAAGADWSFGVNLVVGDASTGHVAIQTTSLGLVTASIGRGAPADPDVEIPVVSDVLPAGSHEWTIDLMGHSALLPPGPGGERWWLRVKAGALGQVTAFTLSHDGVEHVAGGLGPWTANVERVHPIPSPPRPVLLASSATPTAAPGITTTWQVILRNDGAPADGVTTLTVTSADPDVVLPASPFALPTGWPTAAQAVIDVPIEILPGQTDSQPIPLTLTIEDESESFTIAALLPVPWPVIRATGVAIEDGDDGQLDPGERAFLEIEVGNVGGLGSFGGVTCAITRDGGDVDVTVHHGTGGFGLLAVGAREDDDDFEVEVLGGAPGDVLRLRLDCADTAATSVSWLDIELGAAPWKVITALGDPAGDALNASPFDIVAGRYRADGATLDIELVAAEPHDPGTLFIEAWGNSPGGGYTYYQLVVQSGVGVMRGYRLGVFTRLSEPVVTTIGDRTVRISVDLASLGLVVDSINLGFAAGFCGGSSYYCDQYPDAWGNPYQSGLVTGRWVTLSW